MFTPEVAMTARQLHNEVSHYVYTLGGDIERCFNPDWGLDEAPVNNQTRTELLIIDLSRPSDYPEGVQRAVLNRLLDSGLASCGSG